MLSESCFYWKKTPPNLIKKLFLCFVSKPRVGPIKSKYIYFKCGNFFAGMHTLVLSLCSCSLGRLFRPLLWLPFLDVCAPGVYFLAHIHTHGLTFKILLCPKMTYWESMLGCYMSDIRAQIQHSWHLRRKEPGCRSACTGSELRRRRLCCKRSKNPRIPSFRLKVFEIILNEKWNDHDIKK